MTAGERGLAIFDLDETITRKDTTMPFVLGFARLGHIGVTARWRSLFAGLAAFVRQRNKKNLLLGIGLAGSRRAVVAAEGERFAEDVVRDGLRAEALDAIARHRAAGDRLVLASASIDLYVEPIARRLGFDQAICTRTRWTADGRLTALLEDGNCKGALKARQVQACIPAAELRRAVVYSDSLTDLPLMRAAARGVLICDDDRRAGRARASGLEVLRWR